jgi:hypothetical protein
MIKIDIHETHCRNCIKINECNFSLNCKLIYCPNNCDFQLHECKLDEHINEICCNSFVNCINYSNGCKSIIKRSLLGKHLTECSASVVQCGSYRIRSITNNNKKQTDSKKDSNWPDPIYMDRLSNLGDKNININESKYENINDSFLNLDYNYLTEFSNKYPLKFYRIYSHFLNHVDTKDYTKSKFYFFKHLLVNVKSKIFKDIETENCVIYNDEEGCFTCQTRIKSLERDRFNELKRNEKFDMFLRNIYDFDVFIEEKRYLDENFTIMYDKYYFEPFLEIKKKQTKQFSDEFSELETEMDTQNRDYLLEKLYKYNNEIIKLTDLNKCLKLNTLESSSCEPFQMNYELYRIKETEFRVDCESILRRDEFTDHYSFFHNFLFPNLESVHICCPLNNYGCDYFAKGVCFEIDKNMSEIHLDQMNGRIRFKINNNNETNSVYNHINLLDLPSEILYRIVSYLVSCF